MKVLLVDAASDGHHGIYAARLMEGLRRQNIDYMFLTADGFQAELAGSQGEQLVLRKLRVSSESMYSRLLSFSTTVWMAELTARRLKATHVHYLSADGLIMPFAGILPWCSQGRVRILTIHWSTNVSERNKRSTGLRKAYHLLKEKMFAWTCRFVDRVIVHGERSLNELRTLAPTSKDKITEVLYGTDLPDTFTSRAEARSLLKLPTDRPLILFFGAPRPDKGLDFLLDSLEAAAVPATLVVAGSQGDEGLENRLTTSRVDVVRRSGYVADEEIGYYFAASDVVVLPYQTIFGGQSGPMSIAAAHGVPVVCTDVGDMGATVKRYGFGQVVPPDDGAALTHALTLAVCASEIQREEWARKGREYAANISWPHYAAQVIHLYGCNSSPTRGK